MKKITKAVFGSGRPCGLNQLCRLACAEDGLGCVTKFLAVENSNGVPINETHY